MVGLGTTIGTLASGWKTPQVQGAEAEQEAQTATHWSERELDRPMHGRWTTASSTERLLAAQPAPPHRRSSVARHYAWH